MNGTVGELPRRQPDNSIEDKDCQVQCRTLWPTDNTMALIPICTTWKKRIGTKIRIFTRIMGKDATQASPASGSGLC